MKKEKKKHAKNIPLRPHPSVPDHLNITWGKKYSLKDRTPVVMIVIFIACLFVLLSFLSVSPKDEDSIDDKGERVRPIERDIK